MGIVTIHVFDEQRQSKRDFTCEVQMLLHTMKYFKQFLGDVGPGQDAEISVQCDVVTFEWLMAYTKAGKAEDDPVMNLDNCLRIMISSSFLKVGAQVVLESYVPATCLSAVQHLFKDLPYGT